MVFDLFHLSAQLFSAYLLTACRIIGLFISMPLFGERTVPWQTKVGISMILAFLLLPAARVAGPLPTDSLLGLGVAGTHELLIGFILGYLARLLFGAFQFAVNAVDFQMGLGFVQVINPGFESKMSVLGQFLNTLLMLLFLEIDGHHVLLRTLAQTFDLVPLGVAVPQPGASLELARVFAVMVILSLQIALPTVLVLLLIDVAMGIVGRVVPQIHVFVVALPIKIVVGLVTVSLTLPALATVLGRLIETIGNDVGLLVRLVH